MIMNDETSQLDRTGQRKKPDSRAVFVGRRTYVIKLNSDCRMIQNLNEDGDQ